jgi:glycosyltransferase involved in cell wall biosynthesis
VIGELIERKPSDFRRNFVFLGSLGLRKGLPVLLEASKFLREDSRLLIMGRTDDYATKLLLQKRNRHNLEIIDGPDRTEVLNQLSKADVFLFPSFYEGFGIAILEAMSFGCIPVVSRNTCGPDILKGTSFESFLFDAGDLLGFVESIRVLEELSTVQLRKLQAEARSVSEQFTFQNFGKNCVDFLFENKYL